MTTSFLFKPDVMQHTLQNSLADFASVQWLSQIHSTNSYLLQAARDIEQESFRPALLGAHYQTTGKGRLGRKWLGESGVTLMFSCAYDVYLTPIKLPMLAPIAGIVACEQIRQTVGAEYAHYVTMKWPNDIQYHDGKLSGLLVESLRPMVGRHNEKHHVVVVGMGMNLMHAQELSVHLGRKVADWTSILQDMHKDNVYINHSIALLVARIAKAWKEAFALYEVEGFTPFIKRHRAIDALYHQAIDVWQDKKRIMSGIAKGLNEDAHLLVEQENGQIIPLLNGDISIRQQGDAL